MLDDVIHRFEDGHVSPLDCPPLCKITLGEASEDAIDVGDRLLEIRQKNVPGGTVASRKLSGAIPARRRAADAAHDPLSQVAREMNEKVADAVRVLVGAPPDRFRRQRLDGPAQLGSVFRRQIMPRALDEKWREPLASHRFAFSMPILVKPFAPAILPVPESGKWHALPTEPEWGRVVIHRAQRFRISVSSEHIAVLPSGAHRAAIVPRALGDVDASGGASQRGEADEKWDAPHQSTGRERRSRHMASSGKPWPPGVRIL